MSLQSYILYWVKPWIMFYCCSLLSIHHLTLDSYCIFYIYKIHFCVINLSRAVFVGLFLFSMETKSRIVSVDIRLAHGNNRRQCFGWYVSVVGRYYIVDLGRKMLTLNYINVSVIFCFVLSSTLSRTLQVQNEQTELNRDFSVALRTYNV